VPGVDQPSMPSLKQKSTRPSSTFSLLAAIAACVAALAVPSAALAASPATPELRLDPVGYDFGLQPLYNTAQTTFQLHNDGSEEAWIESIEFGGPDSGSFWSNSSCWSGALLPGGSCSIEVNFNPNEPRAYSAELRVKSAGVYFEAAIGGEGASPYFTSEPNPVDFGSAKVGDAGNTREIEVTNAGNWPGGVFIAVISGGAVASFQLIDENCTNRLIAPAETCTAQVRFRPVSEGVKKATLSLFGESDGGSQVVLTGVGAAPDPAPASPPESEPAAAAAGAAAVAPAPSSDRAAAAARRRIKALEARLSRVRAHRLRSRRLRARRTRMRRLRAQRRAHRIAQRRHRARARHLRQRHSR